MDHLDLRKEFRQLCPSSTLPGRLVLERRQVVQAEAIDVSRTGLGITAKEHLAPGTAIWLILGDRTIRLEVRYCIELPESSTPGQFRVGLASQVPWENLVALLQP